MAELARRRAGAARGPLVAEARSFRGATPVRLGRPGTCVSCNFNLRAAETVGLIGERKSGDGHYDRFRHRLMFAWSSICGQGHRVQRAALEEPPRTISGKANIPPARAPGSAPSEPSAKYYNLARVPIYRKRRRLWPVSASAGDPRASTLKAWSWRAPDVLSLHAQGVRHVVAPFGTAHRAARQIACYTRQVTFCSTATPRGSVATHAREPLPERRAPGTCGPPAERGRSDELCARRHRGSNARSRLARPARTSDRRNLRAVLRRTMRRACREDSRGQGGVDRREEAIPWCGHGPSLR